MKKYQMFLVTIPFLVIPILGLSSSSSSTTADKVDPDYDCAVDFQNYMSSKTEINAQSKYWMHEALNYEEFIKADQGLDLADSETGKFPLLKNWTGDDEFTTKPLSFKTYPLRTNADRVEKDTGTKYFVQDPTGWKMTNNSNPSSIDAWPSVTGKCSADSTNFKVYEDGRFVLSTGMGLVTYFYAPQDGVINIDDTVTVPSDDTDGVYLSIFHINWQDIGCNNWNWNYHCSLSGATPLYPTQGVKVSSDLTTGWKQLASGESTSYKVENVTIEKWDLLAFVYVSKNSYSNNEITSSPKITYISSPNKEVDFEEYSTSTDFPGVDGNYEHVISSGNYPWTYQALNLKAFYSEGKNGMNPLTGQLSTVEENYGLQMYSTFRNTTHTEGDATKLYPGHDDTAYCQLDNMWAYPKGYKVGYYDSDVNGTSVTGSVQWLKVGSGQYIHPGFNVAVATCFFAPKSGTISISDSIYIPDFGSDGIDVAIYKQPKDYIYKGIKLFSSADAFSLYGATPVYPTPGVNICDADEDYAGWLHVTSGTDFKYKTGAIEVEKNDMIVILYSAHDSTSYDTTYTSPTVTYLSKEDSISLDHYNVPIAIGETLQLNATILPTTSRAKTVTWTSDDESIATVDVNGLVTGVGEGTTSIWATLENGSKAYCLVKVHKA